MKPAKYKIIVVGGGVVESDDEGFFARSQLVEYLQGFLNFYQQVCWATPLSQSHDYRTKLDGVKLDVINRGSFTFYSLKGMARQCMHYVEFAKRLDKKTDVIISNLSSTSFIYVLCARMLGRRLMLYMGSDPILTLKLKKTLLGKLISAANLALLPMTIALAHEVFVRGETTLKFCSCWNRRSRLSNPIISYNVFSRQLRDESPKIQGIKFLYVGKLDDNKGVSVLLEAFYKALNQGCAIDISLDFVGNGPQKNKLLQKVNELGIRERIVFHGFIDDPEQLSDIFLNSDVLVVPTIDHEGFPRVIDEAAACGLPVICTRVGGMAFLQEGIDAIFVEPGDVNGTAEILGRFASDADLRQKMVALARAKAKSYLKEPASYQHASALLHPQL